MIQLTITAMPKIFSKTLLIVAIFVLGLTFLPAEKVYAQISNEGITVTVNGTEVTGNSFNFDPADQLVIIMNCQWSVDESLTELVTLDTLGGVCFGSQDQCVAPTYSYNTNPSYNGQAFAPGQSFGDTTQTIFDPNFLVTGTIHFYCDTGISGGSDYFSQSRSIVFTGNVQESENLEVTFFSNANPKISPTVTPANPLGYEDGTTIYIPAGESVTLSATAQVHVEYGTGTPVLLSFTTVNFENANCTGIYTLRPEDFNEGNDFTVFRHVSCTVNFPETDTGQTKSIAATASAENFSNDQAIARYIVGEPPEQVACTDYNECGMGLPNQCDYGEMCLENGTCIEYHQCPCPDGGFTCHPPLIEECTNYGICGGGQGEGDCTYGYYCTHWGNCNLDDRCLDSVGVDPDVVFLPGTIYSEPYGTTIQNIDRLLGGITGFLYPVAIGFGFLGIITAGYKYMTSEGDPPKVKEAQEELTAAIIGIVFILLSVFILDIIITGVIGA